MRTTFVILAFVAFWVALLPPLFTQGGCAAEFALATQALHLARPQLGTLDQAQAYLSARAIPYALVAAENCERWPGVDACAGGPVLLGALPVKNRVCRLYRDNSVHLQLAFNSAQQLVRLQTEMKPSHILRVPLLPWHLEWGS
jgi:hypothetical protein